MRWEANHKEIPQRKAISLPLAILLCTTMGLGLRENNEAKYNTAVGSKALYSNTTGPHNTSLGYHSVYNLHGGGSNTVVGSLAFPTGSTTYTNYTGFGYYVGSSVSDPSNRVEIGNTSVSWIGGQVTWSTYSDERIKTM